MEKYGFVYIWFDRKHKRFYIGSHWGAEDDGYVCSSPWMLKAYKRRPTDFRRKILKVVYDRKSLLEEEYSFLSRIKPHEIKTKYYNLNTKATGHWSASSDTKKYKSIKQRISENTKAAMYREDVREKYLKGLEKRDTKSSESEVREKRRQSMKQTMAKKFPIEERKPKPVEFGSEEYKKNMAISVSESWKSRDKKAIGEKISESLAASKEHRSKTISSLKWYNNGVINKRLASHPGDGWTKGRIK